MARTLKRGDRGLHVRRLQTALINMGFSVGAAGSDGDFGAGTKAAVERFQADRGLPETGIADPKTIAALDLDPDTLEDLIEIHHEEGADVILLEDADRTVQDYADTRADFEAAIVNSLQNALESFESVIIHASTKEAKADVMGSVLDKLLDSLVKDVFSELAKVNPWAKIGEYALDGLKAASEEMKRAEAARRSVTARDWISHQRAALDQAGWRMADRARIREDTHRELSSADDGQSFLEGLARATQAFRDSRFANRAMLSFELTLFESWINAFFTGTRGPGQGYVVLIFDTDPDMWKLRGTRLLAPYGEKVSDRLGQILAPSADPSYAGIRKGLRPFALDLKVHKYVVFGHSHSKFLDAEDTPEWSRQAMLQNAYPQWGAFFDPDNERLTNPTDELSRLRMQSALGNGKRLNLNGKWS